MATPGKQSAALTSPGYLVPFIAVTVLFFIFGFITNLNMALAPYERIGYCVVVASAAAVCF